MKLFLGVCSSWYLGGQLVHTLKDLLPSRRRILPPGESHILDLPTYTHFHPLSGQMLPRNTQESPPNQMSWQQKAFIISGKCLHSVEHASVFPWVGSLLRLERGREEWECSNEKQPEGKERLWARRGDRKAGACGQESTGSPWGWPSLWVRERLQRQVQGAGCGMLELKGDVQPALHTAGKEKRGGPSSRSATWKAWLEVPPDTVVRCQAHRCWETGEAPRSRVTHQQEGTLRNVTGLQCRWIHGQQEGGLLTPILCFPYFDQSSLVHSDHQLQSRVGHQIHQSSRLYRARPELHALGNNKMNITTHTGLIYFLNTYWFHSFNHHPGHTGDMQDEGCDPHPHRMHSTIWDTTQKQCSPGLPWWPSG